MIWAFSGPEYQGFEGGETLYTRSEQGVSSYLLPIEEIAEYILTLNRRSDVLNVT